MTHSSEAPPVRPLLETELARPYHYRRDGVYYLRIRPKGRKETATVSLRTRHRPTAMALSKDLLTTLHTFHLGNPESQWPELKAKLLEIAEDSLGTATGIDELDVALLNHSEALEYLHLIGQVGGLTVDQAKARRVAIRIVQGVMTKLEKGDTQQLEEVIKELRADEPVKVVTTTKPEEAPQEGSPVYFAELGENYLKEQGLNVRESTLNNLKSTVKTISDYMGTTDMRTHTRGDLLDLRDYLLLERKVSTVNRILTTLSGVLEYAVNSGMIEKAWDKKLKILKGADSSREAFSQAQVKGLVTAMNKLDKDSPERWAVTLAAITGARVGEIHQLTKDDVRQIGSNWVLDFNEGKGKTLKNKYSKRVVPLMDGAHGFDLQGFLGFVDRVNDRTSLFTQGYAWFAVKLNQLVRTTLEIAEGNKELTFHSLRHSMASLMKSKAIPLVAAQAILGHSSQSITYDLYGGDETLEVDRMAEALKVAFSL